MAVPSKPGLGLNSWVGFGQESTYGTRVPVTNYLPIKSETLMKEVKKLEAISILRRGVLDNQVVPGEISVAGSIVFPVQYDVWGPLAYQAFGAVAHSQPDVTNAPTAWRHRFTIADVLPAALSFEIFRDTTQFITEPNKSFSYTGCKVSKFDFMCKVGEVAEMTVDILGQNETRIATSNITPAFSNETYCVFTQGILQYNGNDLEVDNVTVSLANSLGYRYKLGSRVTREPVPDNKLLATGSFDCEFQDWNEYDDFVNVTERSLSLNFTGPTIGGSITKALNFTMGQIFLEKVKLSLDKPGRIMMTVDFKCYRKADGTQNEIIMDLINTNSGL